MVNDLKQTVEEVLKDEKAKYDSKRAECVAGSSDEDNIDLDMRIRIVDGDTVLSDTANEGSFLSACKVFEKYVQTRYASKA